MKTFYILILFICFSSLKAISQKMISFIDSVERTFQRNDLNTAVTCDLKLERKVDDLGKVYFINSGNTRVDVGFFNVTSIPFYNDFQTYFGSATAYVNWLKYKNPVVAGKELSIIEKNRDSSYVIVKLSDPFNKTFKIISRQGNILYCISMTSDELSNDRQIGYLKFYLKTNKRIHLK